MPFLCPDVAFHAVPLRGGSGAASFAANPYGGEVMKLMHWAGVLLVAFVAIYLSNKVPVIQNIVG